jgi:hypothetical protein
MPRILGSPLYTCSYCKPFFLFAEHAIHFSAFSQRRMAYNHCCKGGRVCLDPYKQWTAPLDRMIRFSGGGESTEFMWLIRSYNSMFAFSG